MTPIRADRVTRAPRRAGRTLLVGLLIAVLLVVLAAGTAASAQAVLDARDRALVTSLGRTVTVDGVTMHVRVTGPARTSSPVVLLDAASLSTLAQWAWVQDGLSGDTTVVSFDRPGMGGSEEWPGEPTAAAYAALLGELLDELGLPGPYVLVGHSMGALTIRAFAHAHPDDVAGLVLVDPRAYGLEQVYPGEDLDPRRDDQLAAAPWLARLGLIRLARPLADRVGELPEYARDPATAALASTRQADGALDDVLLGEDSARLLRGREDLEDRPVVVVTAGRADDVAFPGVLRRRYTAQQDVLLTLTTAAERRVVAGADHYTIVTRPEHAAEVVAAVRSVIDAPITRG